MDIKRELHNKKSRSMINKNLQQINQKSGFSDFYIQALILFLAELKNFFHI